MATLAEIKTRIIAETNRDDLADDLASQLILHIQRACEFFADEHFWFNAIVTTANTTPGSDLVAVPATVRRVERLTIPAQFAEVVEVQLGQIEVLDGAQTALPWRYAYYNNQLKLWPIPDQAYTLQITGLAQIDAPAADGDSNAWTEEAQDLIVARASMTLYRDQFRDTDGVQLAASASKEALARLKRETGRRLRTPLRACAPRQPFNINAG